MKRVALLGALLVALLVGGAQAAGELTLTVVAQTNSTITLGWTPQPGYGYLFSVNGSVVSRTNDPSRSQVKFQKVTNGVYEVAVIVKGATGTYPPPAPPPPSPACSDGTDNDGDGKIDYPADPGCTSATDTSETDPLPPPAGTVTQTIVNGSTISNITGWRAVYDANGDGTEDDPGSIRFLVDGTQILSEINAPFGDTFATGSPSVADGQHTFRVDAVNDANTVIATNSVTATVSSGTPPPPPPTSGYPDATNTGVPAGTTLTPIVNTNITANGAVVNAVSTSGCLVVTGTGVTIKNSRIGCVIIDGGAAGNPANPPLTIQDTEIVCPIGDWNTGIRFHNFVALRLNIHGCENGLDISDHAVVRDSYIHDLATGGALHSDGIQGQGNNSTIEHNTIYAFTGTAQGTSAIIFNGATVGQNAIIRNNLMAGGAYTLYCPSGSVPSFQVLDNHFSRISLQTVGAFGPWTDCEGETLSGNVYHETGQLLPGQTSSPPPPAPAGCPLPAYPDASCTGVPAGTTLTPSGGLTISTAGTVIDGRDITGQVVVNAPNVTIRNTRIRSNSMWVIDNNSTGLVIEDSEIINRPVSGQPNCHNGIGNANFTVRRTEITGCENAMNIDSPGNVVFEDNYVHDLDTTGPSYVWGNDPHTDGIQMGQNANNVVVRHNSIDPVGASGGGATSAIIMYVSADGPSSNVWIEDNYLDGRNASYALYVPRVQTHDIYVNRNRMGRGAFGYTACVKVGITVTEFTDNRDAFSAALISPDNGAGGSCTN